MSNNEVISILNGLVQTCKRGEEVFRRAAENIRNSEFRRLFNIFAQQRAQFTSELQSEVHRWAEMLRTVAANPPPRRGKPFHSAGLQSDMMFATRHRSS